MSFLWRKKKDHDNKGTSMKTTEKNGAQAVKKTPYKRFKADDNHLHPKWITQWKV